MKDRLKDDSLRHIVYGDGVSALIQETLAEYMAASAVVFHLHGKERKRYETKGLKMAGDLFAKSENRLNAIYLAKCKHEELGKVLAGARATARLTLNENPLSPNTVE